MSKRPSLLELQAAYGKTLPDIIKPGLTILFVGINPGLYTAAVGHHFARPGNRFWTSLYAGGFTPRLFNPAEDKLLLDLGYGITSVVSRATNTAAELTKEEFIEGGKILEQKVVKYSPNWLAFIGIEAYRMAFNQPKAKIGPQSSKIGTAHVWVLPSTSGLNAHYTPTKLGELFGQLYQVSNM